MLRLDDRNLEHDDPMSLLCAVRVGWLSFVPSNFTAHVFRHASDHYRPGPDQGSTLKVSWRWPLREGGRTVRIRILQLGAVGPRFCATVQAFQ